MVSFPTISERLEYIVEACKYPTPKAFTDALDEEAQQWRNWRTRNSVGRAGTKICELTGVTLDWLTRGKGEPFPDGPKLYAGVLPAGAVERLERAERHIQDLTGVVGLLIAKLAASSPAEGAAVAMELRKTLTNPEYESAVLPPLLRVAEAAVPYGKSAGGARLQRSKR